MLSLLYYLYTPNTLLSMLNLCYTEPQTVYQNKTKQANYSNWDEGAVFARIPKSGGPMANRRLLSKHGKSWIT